MIYRCNDLYSKDLLHFLIYGSVKRSVVAGAVAKEGEVVNINFPQGPVFSRVFRQAYQMKEKVFILYGPMGSCS